MFFQKAEPAENSLKEKSKKLQKRVHPVDSALLDRDMEIIEAFTKVYCQHHHAGYSEGILCPECQELIAYARIRREKCPYDPKPKCKECPTHCYQPKYRERMKAIMRFSGMYFVKRGRIDWLIKYFLRRG